MWAYCDEGGHFADKDFICIVGIVFDTDNTGNSFEIAWRKEVLAKHGLSGVHTKTLLKDVGLDRARYRQVISDCASVIPRAFVAFGVGFDAKHWRTICAANQRAKQAISDPYRFCVDRILRKLNAILKALGATAGYSITFDRGHDMDWHRRINFLMKIRPEIQDYVRALCFADDRVYIPVQAADVLANLTSRYWQNPSAGPGPDLEKILKSGVLDPRNTEMWDKDELDREWPNLIKERY